MNSSFKTLGASGLAGWATIVLGLVLERLRGPGDALFWTLVPVWLSVGFALEFLSLTVPAYLLLRRKGIQIRQGRASIIGASAFALCSAALWCAFDGVSVDALFFAAFGAAAGGVSSLVLARLLNNARQSTPGPAAFTVR
ncbi:MAG: hypothetical protein NTX64_18900 [Elusimicrobia bacterium]|nr:hypothetical protein [Elusimicrobiota bacterium]